MKKKIKYINLINKRIIVIKCSIKMKNNTLKSFYYISYGMYSKE